MRTKDRAYEDLTPDLEALLELLPHVAPGKRTRAERLPARPSSELPRHSDHHGGAAAPAPLFGGADPFGLHLPGAVQLRASGAASATDIHATAAAGLAEPSSSLPFLSEIQASFGPTHDVTSIHAHIGGAASPAAAAMGATAYAAGEHVAFAAAPDLHTAAHEAAHVVQQRAGLSLAGGVGSVGDAHERHADAVADAVVRGESAAALLGAPSSASATAGAVQHKKIAPSSAGSSAIPLLEASPAVVHLTGATVGTSRSAQIQVTNREPASVELVDLLTSTAGLQGWIIGPRTLEPDQSTTVTITFEPTSAGALHGKITLITFDGAGFDIPVEADVKVFGPQLPPASYRALAPAAPAKAPAKAPASPAPSTAATPSPLFARPEGLRFGPEITGDVASLVTVYNVGADPVSIDAVTVVGGRHTFEAKLVGSGDLLPGSSASIAVEYRPALNIGEPASLHVLTSDGGTLEIPLHSPQAATPETAAGVLQVSPQHVELERPAGGYAQPARVVVRNRSRNPVTIHHTNFQTSTDQGPFRLSWYTYDKQHTILPGADLVATVNYSGTTPGTHTDQVWFQDADRNTVGTFSLRGTTVAATAPDPVPSPATNQDEPEVCAPLDPETEKARRLAVDQLVAWDKAVNRAVGQSFKALSDEWTLFLSYTGLNPSISRAALPDSSLLRNTMSNAFGNTLTTGALDPGKLKAPVARGVAGGVAGLASDDLAIAVGLLAGTGVGFVVGVLVETLASVLFDKLLGDDEAARAQMQAVYDQGRTDGALQVGAQIGKRNRELGDAETTARLAQEGSLKKRLSEIQTSCDAGALREVTALMREEAADTVVVSPAKGVLSRQLMALWARDHAASTTSSGKEVVSQQWKNVTTELAKTDADHFAAGKIKNQPDLFISQCTREWESRGLTTPPALQGSLRDMLGSSPEQLADVRESGIQASAFFRLFQGREFLWDRGMVRWDVLDEGMPKRGGEGARDWEAVSCQLTLDVKDGSCIVTTFRYRIQGNGGDVEAFTSPGRPSWRIVEDRPGVQPSLPPPHARSRELFAMVGQLEQAGFTVKQEPDADDNSWLQAMFGKAVAQPRSLHVDGRAESVSVFRVVQQVPNLFGYRPDQACPEGTKLMPQRLADRLTSFRTMTQGNYVLYQGGNTMMVIERCDAR